MLYLYGMMGCKEYWVSLGMNMDDARIVWALMTFWRR